ncbi:unnamed protein product [Paramecium sonneborni]|uniref:Uncharacterized protein n=1 Tax=Paramecium sonneborni TaxID=65129 RepID=A0A8S1QGH3_9CILI|nr:unnamed protein product [Paramecium sonneborni]
MGTCSQCTTKYEIIESETFKKYESVDKKLLELNQISKTTIFEKKSSNQKRDNDQLINKVFEDSIEISEVNQEKDEVLWIHESLKRGKRKYSFQQQMKRLNHEDKKVTKNQKIIHVTDPNLAQNFSNSSSSMSQFCDLSKHLKMCEKQNIQSNDSKSIKSILKKRKKRNSESKSVHFACNTESSQSQLKSRSCSHSKKKKKKRKIQFIDNYQF